MASKSIDLLKQVVKKPRTHKPHRVLSRNLFAEIFPNQDDLPRTNKAFKVLSRNLHSERIEIQYDSPRTHKLSKILSRNLYSVKIKNQYDTSRAHKRCGDPSRNLRSKKIKSQDDSRRPAKSTMEKTSPINGWTVIQDDEDDWISKPLSEYVILGDIPDLEELLVLEETAWTF